MDAQDAAAKQRIAAWLADADPLGAGLVWSERKNVEGEYQTWAADVAMMIRRGDPLERIRAFLLADLFQTDTPEELANLDRFMVELHELKQ